MSNSKKFKKLKKLIEINRKDIKIAYAAALMAKNTMESDKFHFNQSLQELQIELKSKNHLMEILYKKNHERRQEIESIGERLQKVEASIDGESKIQNPIEAVEESTNDLSNKTGSSDPPSPDGES